VINFGGYPPKLDISSEPRAEKRIIIGRGIGSIQTKETRQSTISQTPADKQHSSTTTIIIVIIT
jgi:hypothetical protein